MNKYGDEPRARKRRINAKVAVITIVGAIVVLLLLEFQEFLHLSSRLLFLKR